MELAVCLGFSGLTQPCYCSGNYACPAEEGVPKGEVRGPLASHVFSWPQLQPGTLSLDFGSVPLRAVLNLNAAHGA
jgi:hypothetical protein